MWAVFLIIDFSVRNHLRLTAGSEYFPGVKSNVVDSCSRSMLAHDIHTTSLHATCSIHVKYIVLYLLQVICWHDNMFYWIGNVIRYHNCQDLFFFSYTLYYIVYFRKFTNQTWHAHLSYSCNNFKD